MTKITILKTNAKTSSGYFYPRDMIENLLPQFNEGVIYGVLDGGLKNFYNDTLPRGVPTNDIAFEVSGLNINDDGELYGELKILSTPCGEILTDLDKKTSIKYHAVGIGQLRKIQFDEIAVSEVQNYQLMYVNAIPEQISSFSAEKARDMTKQRKKEIEDEQHAEWKRKKEIEDAERKEHEKYALTLIPDILKGIERCAERGLSEAFHIVYSNDEDGYTRKHDAIAYTIASSLKENGFITEITHDRRTPSGSDPYDLATHMTVGVKIRW